jgi:hypothetical protein
VRCDADRSGSGARAAASRLRPMPADHLIYVSAHAALDCQAPPRSPHARAVALRALLRKERGRGQDSELRGGNTSALSVFGDAAAAVRGSVLRHAGVGVEFDDSCKVALRDCVLEHNRAAFRVTPRGRPRAEILRCDISGELYGSAVCARGPLCVRPAPMAVQLGRVRWYRA